MRLILPAILGLSLSTVSHVSAATYVVRPDGTGDFPTIQEAITASVDGDVIELADGEYSGPGNQDIRFGGKAVTVTSQSGDFNTCKITYTDVGTHDVGFYFIDGEGPGSVLRGIDIASDYLWGTNAAVECRGSEPLIERCRMTANPAVASLDAAAPTFEECVFWRGSGITVFSASITLLRCRMERMTREELHGGAIYAQNSDVTATECIFLRNGAFSLGFAPSGGAIYADGCNLSLSNCTFVRNSASRFTNNHTYYDGQGAAIAVGGGTAHISNCTFAGNKGESTLALGALAGSLTSSIIFTDFEDVAIRGGSYLLYSCVNIFGNAPWPAHLGEPGSDGNISADPLFCDLDNFDVSLASTSPCLPGNHPDGVECGLIGAVGEGCIQVPVREVPWGRIKARYK